MKKNLVAAALIACIVLKSITLSAQEKPAEAPAKAPAAQGEAMMALAKAAQNPVADMNSVPIQFNWTSGGIYGNQTQSTTNIQPVLPLPLTKNLNIVSRTIIPVVTIPVSANERVGGIADIQEQLFISPNNTKPGKLIWGLGPIASFPTATNPLIATGQFAVGPTAVLLAMPGKFVLGLLANQLWRIAGSTSTTAISAFFTQPFINYNLKKGWSLACAPAITSNWSAPSGQQWTIPVGMGVSKITFVGKQPLNISLQYYHNAVRPDNAGADMVRMQCTFLFPR